MSTWARSAFEDPSLLRECALAILLACLSFAIRWILDPLLGTAHAFTLAFVAVVLATWYGSWRGGLLCAVLAYLPADYLFVDPRYSILVRSARDAASAAMYWALTVVLLYVVNRATKARRAAKALIARLEAANAHYSEIVFTIAHELRTPLSAMSAAIGLQSAAQATPELHRRASDVLSRQVLHMTRITEDLMDAARISEGKTKLELQPTPVADLIRYAVDSVQPALQKKRQTCDLAIPAEIPPLMLDAVRMTQVLSNLLVNASKFSPEGTSIRVDAQWQDPSLRVAVIDHGAGIPEDKLKSVFDTYYQVGLPGQGIGLGLSLVRKLVELHGGTVQALSEGEGKGASFVVHLPRPRRADTAAG